MNNKGIIIKSQKELYYVDCGGTIYKSKARGVFRDKDIKPLVGDYVNIKVLDNENALIENVLERKNYLVRPPIANVDQIILVASLTNPKINYNIFDKYIVMLEHFNVDINIVINKIDLASKEEINEFESIYSKTPYNYIFTSNQDGNSIDKIRKLLKNKVSALAGPSGVGKSTLINMISKQLSLETGNISIKTNRGKHTTRHIELFEIDKDSFIFDTPGFTALNLDFIEDYNDVKNYFTEFNYFSKECKFKNCIHINEPNCGVKSAIDNNLISPIRYKNYVYIVEEIKNKRRY